MVIMNEDIWYSRAPLLSHSQAMIYVGLGGRGVGKTFDFKRWAVLNNKPFEFIWLRRYDNELPKVKNSFLTDLKKVGVLGDREFRIEGNQLLEGDTVKVHFEALSLATKNKSVSYANVDVIVFDEFIEERANRSYLPDEVELLLSFIETVNRLRLDRPEVRVIMLANKATWVNPYFAYWHIKPFSDRRFKSFKDGLIVVENYTNERFEAAKKQTKFGRLISGTKVGDYMIENKVWHDDNAFIMKRAPNTELRVIVRLGDVRVGLFTGDGNIYCCHFRKSSTARCYAPREERQQGEYPLQSGEPPISWLMEYSSMSKLYFEDNILKSTVYEIILKYYK